MWKLQKKKKKRRLRWAMVAAEVLPRSCFRLEAEEEEETLFLHHRRRRYRLLLVGEEEVQAHRIVCGKAEILMENSPWCRKDFVPASRYRRR